MGRMEERNDGRREDGGQEEGKGEKQWISTAFAIHSVAGQ